MRQSVKMAQNEAERPTCGKLAAPCRHRWHAKPPTSLVKTSPCRAAPSRKWSSACAPISAKYGLPIVIFGHAGDGNLHPNILFDKRQPEQWQKSSRWSPKIFAASLALGGTLSGEHGVGVLKRPYLERALGRYPSKSSGSIKQALDPLNILNPGKIFLINPISGATCQKKVKVPVKKLVDFMIEALTAMGHPSEDAKIIADVLITSDLWGVRSHGVAHLKMYHERIKNGIAAARHQLDGGQGYPDDGRNRWRQWDGHGGGLPCHENGDRESQAVSVSARWQCATPAIMVWPAIIPSWPLKKEW